MFETRGYMLDISRDRVPTLRTLRLIVDILARYRYNQFQLTPSTRSPTRGTRRSGKRPTR